MGSYPELKGKFALVTGGSAGIGKHVALKLAEDGANVAIIARDKGRGEAVADTLQKKGTDSFFVSCDVRNPEEVETACAEVRRRFGKIEILVNCAGGFSREVKFSEYTVAEWDDILNSNLRSAFLCIRLVLPGMMEQKWGRIVNIASLVGQGIQYPTSAPYAAAKAGIMGLTRNVAIEVARYGITVNATSPGFTRSERILRLRTPEFIAERGKLIPVGRVSEPEEQAAAVLFLCSDGAAFITGTTINVSGGVILS